jgi:RNA polymerase primary sigma factor
MGKFKVLTVQEQNEVARTYQAGVEAQKQIDAGADTPENRRLVRKGEEARLLFFNSNLRLVVSIAKRYPVPEGMEQIDLIQEGNLGLDRAIRKFNPEKGFRFSTYATFWIRQNIGRAIEKNSLVKTPAERLGEARAAVRRSNGDYNSLTEEEALLISAAHPLSLDKEIQGAARDSGGHREMILSNYLSHDTLRFDNPDPNGQILFDIVDTQIEIVEAIELLRDHMDSELYWILLKRCGIYDKGKKPSFGAIGQCIGKSQEVARRRYNRAIEQAKEILADNGLDVIALLEARG